MIIWRSSVYYLIIKCWISIDFPSMTWTLSEYHMIINCSTSDYNLKIICKLYYGQLISYIWFTMGRKASMQIFFYGVFGNYWRTLQQIKRRRTDAQKITRLLIFSMSVSNVLKRRIENSVLLEFPFSFQADLWKWAFAHWRLTLKLNQGSLGFPA